MKRLFSDPLGSLLVGSVAVVLALLALSGAQGTMDGADSRSLAADGTAPASPAADDTPTYHADVLPILRESCVSCHREAVTEDGGLAAGFHMSDLVAPMPLTTYEEARMWARAIARSVEERRMPPWGAPVEYKGVFSNERYLEDSEIATLVAWAEQGAPAGDPEDAPPLPSSTATEPAGAWAIGEPDLTVQVPEPFCLEENVVDMYVDLLVPVTEEVLPEPRWIKRSQIAPGSPVVHHLNNPHLGSITPGRGPYAWPDGFGILLEAPYTLVLDTHFHKFETGPGSAICDQTGGGFVFYEEGEEIDYAIQWDPIVHPVIDSLHIPAGDPNYSFTGRRHFEEDTYLLATSPHMHLRGKAAKLELEYPDGRMETLLEIPDFDFRWQHRYDFAEPVFMPGGSTLHLTGWWDNSAGNPHNPDPTQDVRWGQATQDEMLTSLFFFADATPLNHVVGEPVPDDVPRGTYRREARGDEHVVRHLDVVTEDGRIETVDLRRDR